MNYIVPTKEIESLWQEVLKYRAQNAKEDRGDMFKKGTPDYILEYQKRIDEFYSPETDASKETLIM